MCGGRWSGLAGPPLVWRILHNNLKFLLPSLPFFMLYPVFLFLIPSFSVFWRIPGSSLSSSSFLPKFSFKILVSVLCQPQIARFFGRSGIRQGRRGSKQNIYFPSAASANSEIKFRFRPLKILYLYIINKKGKKAKTIGCYHCGVCCCVHGWGGGGATTHRCNLPQVSQN